MTLPLRRATTLFFALAAVSPGAPGAAPAPAAPPVVTILGDSITAGLGLPAADALPAQLEAALGRRGVKARVRGAGVSGDTTAGGLARLDFSVAEDTRVCVVELGANDFLQSAPPSATRANLTAIVRRLKARGIRAVLAAGAAPHGAGAALSREFAAAFAAAARTGGAALAPDLLDGVMSRPDLRQGDGLHPNARGVRIIADRLAPVVARALAAPPLPR